MRLRIDIKLRNGTKMTKRITRYVKARIVAFVQEQPAAEWTSGTCRVWYSVKEDFWNEFDFATSAEFRQRLAEITDKGLVDSFATATGASQGN